MACEDSVIPQTFLQLEDLQDVESEIFHDLSY